MTARTAMTQSWANEALLKAAFTTFVKSIDRLDLLIQKKIKEVLREAGLHEPAIAVEATNVYHLDLVELAHSLGFEVYVIDGFQLSNYRKSVGVRVKTDPTDARLLSRFLRNEGEDLRPWTPPPAVYGKLQSLLRR
ncbi:IS110 family transposase, partial [Pseudomonas sp. DCB_PUT]|uniref:IS110 family transposase n=1 Tax=Pseudomonas sp. DCB_PUT TaxID=2993590 RepID=UPI00226F0D28